VLFAARRLKEGSVSRLGVVDLRGCSRDLLRRDLLLCVASVMYPSVGVFSYYGLEDDVVFSRKSVVYLVVQLGFAEYIENLYRVHHII
jgi:uncharacterized membrane protein (DUF4010 family)